MEVSDATRLERRFDRRHRRGRQIDAAKAAGMAGRMGLAVAIGQVAAIAGSDAGGEDSAGLRRGNRGMRKAEEQQRQHDERACGIRSHLAQVVQQRPELSQLLLRVAQPEGSRHVANVTQFD